MKLEYNNKIRDDLYEIREGEWEKSSIAKYGEPEKDKKANEVEDDLTNFMKKFIKNEDDMQNLYEKINQFELYATGQMCFWYKSYYKAGFVDAMSLNKQIKEEKNINKSDEESIIYKNINEIQKLKAK